MTETVETHAPYFFYLTEAKSNKTCCDECKRQFKTTADYRQMKSKIHLATKKKQNHSKKDSFINERVVNNHKNADLCCVIYK